MKMLYNENFKTLKTENEEDIIKMEVIPMFLA